MNHSPEYANGEHKAAFESSYDDSHWATHDFWRGKRLTPAQLLVHDVRLQRPRDGQPARLSIDEVPASSLVPTHTDIDAYPRTLPNSNDGTNRTEQQNLQQLRDSYGWLKWFRGEEGVSNPLQCRWIHISSKFPEYLEGVFLGLSDWSRDPEARLESLRQLNTAIRANERWSKHGKYFSPFCQALGDESSDYHTDCPYLISVPFLDWTVYPGPTPPLRFQIDPREGYASGRSSAHPTRSLLQHKYRLEDTSDREKSQVYSKHKPWREDRDIDLKVRRFYGHYPTGLNVDELWVLVLDEMHVVTFSSNQSWKARWPPLQLPSRIAEISFRGLRKQQFADEMFKTPYRAPLHALVCLNGAVGLVHRSFWTDAPLPCSERYMAQLDRLQYRLYRAPSTKLVLDLLQLQDELAIIEDITKAQIDTMIRIEKHLSRKLKATTARESDSNDLRTLPVMFALGDPDGIVGRLRAELVDLTELRTNTNELVNRTVQLVNLRLEDHGQAILVFTIVTVVFLPLSFLTSFFGMNVSDIRNMSNTQWIFWACAASLTTTVVGASTFLAFYGSKMVEKFTIWKDNHQFDLNRIMRRKLNTQSRLLRDHQRPMSGTVRGGITVLDSTHTGTGRDWDLGFSAS